MITEELTPVKSSYNSTLRDLTPTSLSSFSSHVVKASQRRDSSMIPLLNNSNQLLLLTKLLVTFSQLPSPRESMNSKPLELLQRTTSSEPKELSVSLRDIRAVVREKQHRPLMLSQRKHPLSEDTNDASYRGGLLARHSQTSVTAIIPVS